MDKRAGRMLSCILFLLGCRGVPPSTDSTGVVSPVKKGEIRRISILTPTGWFLDVETDGSGQVGFGSLFHNCARFPKGTINFAELRDTSLSLSVPSGSVSKDIGVAFVRSGGTSTISKYMCELRLTKSLFEKAIASAVKTVTRVAHGYFAATTTT